MKKRLCDRTLLILILISLTTVVFGQAKMLSIKKLLKAPIYLYYNDSLFTVDTSCRRVTKVQGKEIIRLKIYPSLCEKRRMTGCSNEYPYYDFSKVERLLDSLPNLQYLDLSGLPLWEFPQKILDLNKLQILNLNVDGEDCVENKFFSSLMPEKLWKMKNLKYLLIPIWKNDKGELCLHYYQKLWTQSLVPIPDTKYKFEMPYSLDKYDTFIRQRYSSCFDLMTLFQESRITFKQQK